MPQSMPEGWRQTGAADGEGEAIVVLYPSCQYVPYWINVPFLLFTIICFLNHFIRDGQLDLVYQGWQGPGSDPKNSGKNYFSCPRERIPDMILPPTPCRIGEVGSKTLAFATPSEITLGSPWQAFPGISVLPAQLICVVRVSRWQRGA